MHSALLIHDIWYSLYSNNWHGGKNGNDNKKRYQYKPSVTLIVIVIPSPHHCYCVLKLWVSLSTLSISFSIDDIMTPIGSIEGPCLGFWGSSTLPSIKLLRLPLWLSRSHFLNTLGTADGLPDGKSESLGAKDGEVDAILGKHGSNVSDVGFVESAVLLVTPPAEVEEGLVQVSNGIIKSGSTESGWYLHNVDSCSGVLLPDAVQYLSEFSHTFINTCPLVHIVATH